MDRPGENLGDELPVETLARLSAAEARLYPLALVDPEGYELNTSVVGLLADELRRDTADVASALARRAELVDLLPRLSQEAGLADGGLPAEVLVDAALALRCRELGARGAAWGA